MFGVNMQWFIYNFIPMRPMTRLGYIKWVLLENHRVRYRIFHYNYVSPWTRWDLKCESQSKKCECGTRDVQVKKSLNMTFISSSEMKKCIFHECRRHEWNIHFFTSRDEIKIVFTTNIWIFFLLYTSLPIEEMQILHLQGEVWHTVLSIGGDL